MSKGSDDIPGYSYGSATVPRSPVSISDLNSMMASAGMTGDDRQYLRLAGEVLADQTRQIVDHWRAGIIASIPNLGRHSRAADGTPLPDYLGRSSLRFRQWILDTCLRPYDQAWLDYQHEIALRHTTARKNRVDAVDSTPFVPFRDVIAFTAVMNQTIRPYLADKGHSADQVEKMHAAWCKSVQLQIALWTRSYTSPAVPTDQW